jgi:hypothetical protein
MRLPENPPSPGFAFDFAFLFQEIQGVADRGPTDIELASQIGLGRKLASWCESLFSDQPFNAQVLPVRGALFEPSYQTMEQNRRKKRAKIVTQSLSVRNPAVRIKSLSPCPPSDIILRAFSWPV